MIWSRDLKWFGLGLLIFFNWINVSCKQTSRRKGSSSSRKTFQRRSASLECVWAQNASVSIYSAPHCLWHSWGRAGRSRELGFWKCVGLVHEPLDDTRLHCFANIFVVDVCVHCEFAYWCERRWLGDGDMVGLSLCADVFRVAKKSEPKHRVLDWQISLNKCPSLLRVHKGVYWSLRWQGCLRRFQKFLSRNEAFCRTIKKSIQHSWPISKDWIPKDCTLRTRWNGPNRWWSTTRVIRTSALKSCDPKTSCSIPKFCKTFGGLIWTSFRRVPRPFSLRKKLIWGTL